MNCYKNKITCSELIKNIAMTLFFEMILFLVAVNTLLLIFSSNRAK